MTNEEIVSELEKILRRKLVYGGAYVVLADHVENLVERLKTKGSE